MSDPVMPLGWQWPTQGNPGLWFNSTDASMKANVLAASQFEFDTTADFGFYGLSQAGQVIVSDVWASSDEGVFWTSVSQDGNYIAGGGWLSAGTGGKYVGQLRVLEVWSGAVALTQLTGSRVNQIAMTPTGNVLVAACGQTYAADEGNQLYLFSRDQAGAYTALGGFQEDGLSATSVAMSTDGTWVVATFYGPTSVILFRNDGTGLVEKRRWTLPASSAPALPEPDPRRTVAEHRRALAFRGLPPEEASSGGYAKFVSMSFSGSRFAVVGSGTSGVFLFDTADFMAGGSYRWQYVLAGITTSSMVTLSGDGSFLVALSNGSDQKVGYAYRVNDGGTSGLLAWSTPVAYWPNPSNRILDLNARYVSFGTGEPSGSSLTPGCFYVLSAAGGAVLGTYGTPAMSWPFVLAGDGTSAVGGSDDTFVYWFDGHGSWFGK